MNEDKNNTSNGKTGYRHIEKLREAFADLNLNLDDKLDNDAIRKYTDPSTLDKLHKMIEKVPGDKVNVLFEGPHQLFFPENINPQHVEYETIRRKEIIVYKLKEIKNNLDAHE